LRSFANIVADRELVMLGLATPLLLFPGTWSVLGVALIALTWAFLPCWARWHIPLHVPIELRTIAISARC